MPDQTNLKSNPGGYNGPIQEPELWGRYAAFLAHQDASGITGRHFAAEEIEEVIKSYI